MSTKGEDSANANAVHGVAEVDSPALMEASENRARKSILLNIPLLNVSYRKAARRSMASQP